MKYDIILNSVIQRRRITELGIIVIQYVHVCVAETLRNPFKLISVLFYNIVVDTVVYATARLLVVDIEVWNVIAST